MSERLWITWNTQRRNETLSATLDATLVEYKSNASNWIRYPYLSFKTIRTLLKERPKLIFAQNPSLFLAGLVSVIGKIIKVPVVIDAHNAGIYPLEGKVDLLNRIAMRINALADVVIVSNDELKNYLEKQEVRTFAIPDPIPVINAKPVYELDKGKFNVVFVCSWSGDEPYKNVIAAAEQLDDSVCIYITGDSRKSGIDINSMSNRNVVLTGFLSNDEYESLLCSCSVVMVLTEREDCLVCGAYEGISANKPLILSDTRALREYFNLGSTYTGNNSSQIAASIKNARESYTNNQADISTLREIRESELQNKICSLNKYLDTLVNREK
jgi:glycosyltransferase involved in cell wall biosynthesis